MKIINLSEIIKDIPEKRINDSVICVSFNIHEKSKQEALEALDKLNELAEEF